jgi:hypothetical protein
MKQAPFALRVACYFLMTICLVFEGAILAFTGFPFPGLPSYLYVVGFLWGATCLAAVYETIRPRPVLVFLAACLLFLASGAHTLFHSSEEKTLAWFLYLHSLELGIIAAALVLWLLQIRARKAA